MSAARSDTAERTGGDGHTGMVGVIGLGAIGSGMATSLARAGMELAVCDVRTEATEPFAATAVVVATPAELARRCDVIVVAVVDDAQVRTVVSGPQGVLAAASPGLTVIVVSTVSVVAIRAIADEAATAGVLVVDCGVSGGPNGAADGALVCMVGGDPDTVAQIRPVLDAVGSLVVHMGPVGSGLTAKLARNIVQYGSWLAAYEGQVLAEASGIELAKLALVVRASDARIGGASTLMFRPTVAPFTDADDGGLVRAMRAAAALAHKDLGCALEAASVLRVQLPLATMAEGRCDEIFGFGHGEGGALAASADQADRADPARAEIEP